MYFKMMEKLLVTMRDGSQVLMTDITTRGVASSEIKDNSFLYSKYMIQDGETPEIIAHKIYGDSYLHWVILICNDIVTPYYEWPMDYPSLTAHVTDTYGVGNEYAIHHFEDQYGNWVSDATPNATAVTNMEYEDRNNESKRLIKVLQPTYITSFVSEFEKKLRSQVN